MKRRWLILIPSLILASYIFFVLVKLPALEWLEWKAIDWSFSQRGPRNVTGDVVVVAIDDKSLHREGRWPWPREKIARLIQAINTADPAIIEMDIIFAERAGDDAVLASTLSTKNNIILGYYFYQTKKELADAEISPQMREQSFQSILPTAFPDITGLSEALPEMIAVSANADIFAQAALSQGYFNAFPDRDGVIRRFSLMVTHRNKIFPSMALETLSHREQGFDPVPVREDDGSLQGVSVGHRYIPTNKQGQLLINYRGGQEQFPFYSATDILKGSISADKLRDKTIIIGATAVGIYDLRVTPISPNLPGVIVQANLLDNLYRGDFLIQNIWTELASLACMIAITLFLALLLPRLRIMTGLIVTMITIVAYIILSQWLFERGILLALMTPLLEASMLYGTLALYHGFTEEREKRTIRSAFQAYLHPDLVKELTENLDKLQLGGHHADCTILFSDVRNFTSISENMSPEQVVELMNSYFDPIARAIIKEGGYIDKFIGDAVMAIFGAPKANPNHAEQACRAALAMQATVRQLAPQFHERFGIEDFRIGIGLHSGDVIVGNIGTKERLNYTVMGDVVNVSARLETATKSLEADICMSESTYQQVAASMQAKYISEIELKGKREKIRVYKLLGRND